MVAIYIKKNHAQYDLCDSGVYSREIFNMFLVVQVSGLVQNFNVDFLRHHKCHKCQALHLGTTRSTLAVYTTLNDLYPISRSQ